MDSANTPKISTCFTDIVGLRESGIFPVGNEPSIRTLREWTPESHMPSWRADYEEMLGPMFFGPTPGFEEMIAAAANFERTFNTVG